jgi:glycerophosphoryl diester phosphodiesterase
MLSTLCLALDAAAHAPGCAQLCPRASLVTPDLVQRLHAQGFRVRAWGVANGALIRQIVEDGTDGMTVHFLAKLLASMAGRDSLST